MPQFKNVAIARSGIYQYGLSEIANLKVGPVPSQYKDKKVFNVYRPATVLAGAAKKFTKLPVVNTHSVGWINADNFREHALGWTGDSATVEYVADSDEVIIRSSINMFDKEALDLYKDGIREVSPGYTATFKWVEDQATTTDGTPYQITMESVDEGNHLAMVEHGRGGDDARILDHAMSESLLSEFQAFVRKATVLDEETETESFRSQMDKLVTHRKEWSDSMISDAVSKLQACLTDLPVSEEKDKLTRFINDFWQIKNIFVDDEQARKAAELTTALYESLDNSSIHDGGDMTIRLGKKKGNAKDALPEEEKKPDGQATPETEVKPPVSEGSAPVEAKEPEGTAPEGEGMAASEETEQAPMDITSLPDDIDAMNEDQVKFLLASVLKMLKAQAAEGMSEDADKDEPKPDEEKKDEPKEDKEPVGDSKGVFNAPVTGNASVASKNIDDFWKQMQTNINKRGKK